MGNLVEGRNGGKMNRWNRGESGNPKGRPKKLVPSMKVEGYKLTEINDTIQALVSMNVKDLKSVYENPNATILEKTVAAALRKSLEEGDLDSIETLMWDNAELEILRDTDTFEITPGDHHPSQKCHQVMAENIINHIEKM